MASNGRGDYPVSSAWLKKASQLIKPVYPGSDGAAQAMTRNWLFDLATLTSEAGSFTVTGSDATPQKGSKVVCDAGSYTITGANTGLVYAGATSRVLQAGSGSFTLTGSDVALRPGDSVAAASGASTLTGTDASLSHGVRLPCAPGSFIITGLDANLLSGRRVVAGQGSYLSSGIDASFHRLLQSYLTMAAGMGASMDSEFLYPIIRRRIPYKAQGKRVSIKIECNEPGAWMQLIDISNKVLPLAGWTRSSATEVKGTGKHVSLKIASGADPIDLSYIGAKVERYAGQTRSGGVKVKGTGNHISIKISSQAPMELSYIGVQIERYMAQ